MKTKILILALLGSVNVYAFGVQLDNNQTVTLAELDGSGATHISCGSGEPRCILIGDQYGIQYPGQEFNEVVLTETYSASKAMEEVQTLKDNGLCK